MKEQLETIKNSWINAWNHKSFRLNFIAGLILLVIVMIITSYFFNYIQDRPYGIALNDWLLRNIPAINVSTYIVTLMGSAAILFSLRGIANPNMLLTFLFAVILHLMLRMVTITITGFYPPKGLIELKDPMGSMLYQYRFISRDLFYSGHTAIIFLLFLCSFKKADKYYMLFTCIVVGCLLLVQHVHYTLDVASAPLFAYGCFWAAKKIIHYQGAYLDGLESHPV